MASSKPLAEHVVFPFHPYQKGTPLQVARWSGDRVYSTLTVASSAALALPSTVLVEITASENCYINFDTGAVVASSSVASDSNRLFLAGVQIIQVPIDPATGVAYTHIAAIRVDTNGHFQVEALE